MVSILSHILENTRKVLLIVKVMIAVLGGAEQKILKAGLHYQSFYEHSRNFAYYKF